MQTEIYIFGTNSLAKLIRRMIESEGQGKVLGFIVDEEYFHENQFDGLPVKIFSELKGNQKIISALGYSNMRLRYKNFLKIQQSSHENISFISKLAIVAKDVQLGQANIIFPGTQIEAMATIGNYNLLWSQSLVCHECVVGDGNYISANCVIGGLSRMGNNCFFGNSSSTINNIQIANETQVLPGTVLYEDTKVATKYLGVPARPIGDHIETGIIIEKR
jgi:acetyltransferase EpsM